MHTGQIRHIIILVKAERGLCERDPLKQIIVDQKEICISNILTRNRITNDFSVRLIPKEDC